MLSTRYHIGSIVAIFFSLGIGILIGGTLGQKWVHDTESSLTGLLMQKYKEQAAINELLQKQLVSLQLIHRAVSPVFEQKRIVWVGSDYKNKEVLALAVRSAGAEWVEKIWDKGQETFDLWEDAAPDIVLISDPALFAQLTAKLKEIESSGQASTPKLINLSAQPFKLSDPADIANFLIYLKQVMDEGGSTHAAAGFDHHSGME